ncbi:MAG: hypothetical protein ABW185_04790 [Sedimenticola sp.]
MEHRADDLWVGEGERCGDCLDVERRAVADGGSSITGGRGAGYPTVRSTSMSSS